MPIPGPNTAERFLEKHVSCSCGGEFYATLAAQLDRDEYAWRNWGKEVHWYAKEWIPSWVTNHVASISCSSWRHQCHMVSRAPTSYLLDGVGQHTKNTQTIKEDISFTRVFISCLRLNFLLSCLYSLWNLHTTPSFFWFCFCFPFSQPRDLWF